MLLSGGVRKPVYALHYLTAREVQADYWLVRASDWVWLDD